MFILVEQVRKSGLTVDNFSLSFYDGGKIKRGGMDRAIKKRVIVFSLLLSCVFALAIFHSNLVCCGIKLFLGAQLPKGDSLCVNYENGRWEEGSYILENVALSSRGGKDSFDFDARVADMRVTFSLSLFPLKLRSKLEINRPDITLFGVPKVRKNQKKDLYFLCNHYLFRKNLIVNEGKLTFALDKPKELYFFLRTCRGGEQCGAFECAATKEGLDKAPIVTNFLLREGNCAFDVQLAQLDLPWAFGMARFFPIPIDPEIALKEGNLSGHVACELDFASDLPTLSYDLKLLDFAVHHPRYGAKLIAHQINWKEHFTSKEKMRGATSSRFFDKIWPFFIGEGELLGVQIHFDDPKTGVDQGVVELRGKLQFSRQNQPIAQLHGLFLKGGREYPLRVLSEGLVEGEDAWKLAMDISLHEEGQKKMTMYAALIANGSSNYLFETSFDRIGFKPVDLAQHLLAIRYPSVGRFLLTQGMLSGSLKGLIENRRITSLEIHALDVEGAQLLDCAQTLCFSSDLIKGSGEFDFSTDDFFDATFWDLSVTNGSLTANNRLHISKLAANFSMHDQYVKSSHIAGVINGVEADLCLEGLYTHLNLHALLKGAPKNFFGLFDAERASDLPVVDEKMDLDFSIHLASTKEEIGCEGNVDILRQSDLVDSIAFGAKWDREDLLRGGVIAGFSRGWFTVDELSSRYNQLALCLFWQELAHKWHGCCRR